MKIPFNIPFISSNESIYVKGAINKVDTTTNGSYVNKCRTLINGKWNYSEEFLTTSCTVTLKACTLLLDIKPRDKVMVPSYTFSSKSNTFLKAVSNQLETRNTY